MPTIGRSTRQSEAPFLERAKYRRYREAQRWGGRRGVLRHRNRDWRTKVTLYGRRRLVERALRGIPAGTSAWEGQPPPIRMRAIEQLCSRRIGLRRVYLPLHERRRITRRLWRR